MRERGVSGVLGSSAVLGLLAAVAGWNVLVGFPTLGLDPSWEGALYMAAHRGLEAGTQVVFTYGPLGFLRIPGLWYQGLAVIAFTYSAALYVLLGVTLVWRLRMSLPVVAAFLATALLLIVCPTIEVSVALAAAWCLAALDPEPAPLAGSLVLYGGAVLGAVESLVSLRSGPIILIICAIAVAAGERPVRRLVIFGGSAVIAFLLAWFAAGQTIGNLGPYVEHGAQIIFGYSQAMGAGSLTGAQFAAAVVLVVGVVVASVLGAGGGRARWATGLVVAIAGIALYKEAIVREDAPHLQILYSTVVAIGAAITLGRRLVVAGLVVVALALIAITMPRSGYYPIDYNPITHARSVGDAIDHLVNPAHGRDLARYDMGLLYRIDPVTLGLIRGPRIDIDPWEAAVAWVYDLHWDPLPVFQDYSAYTSALDHLNANALSAPGGPARILRENVTRLDPQSPLGDVNSRLQAWDPPAQTIAMLCHFVALHTTGLWQVLGRVPDRCGSPRLVRTYSIANAQTVSLPAAPAGTVLYARLGGVGVSGTESVRTLIYRARTRYVVINRTRTYQLVPGTAADGLIMDAAHGIDFPAPFQVAPGVRSLELEGLSGRLSIQLYALPVGPARLR